MKVRTPYARNPEKLKPTTAQLDHLKGLCKRLDRKVPKVDTKAEANDAISLYLILLGQPQQPGPERKHAYGGSNPKPVTLKQQNLIERLRRQLHHGTDGPQPRTRREATKLITSLLEATRPA